MLDGRYSVEGKSLQATARTAEGAAPSAADASHTIAGLELRTFLHSDGLDHVIYQLNAAHRATRAMRTASIRTGTYDTLEFSIEGFARYLASAKCLGPLSCHSATLIRAGMEL